MDKINISTVKVKQFNSSYKYILMVNGNPICIVRGINTLNNCISYLMNGEPALHDGKIMKTLDKARKESTYETR